MKLLFSILFQLKNYLAWRLCEYMIESASIPIDEAFGLPTIEHD